jgi:hypothetical protein
VQKRGALHHHFLVRSKVPLSDAWVRQAAVDAGYGCQSDLKAIEPGSRDVARYVAKYVTKATDQREEVPWRGDAVDTDSGEVTPALVAATYRTWSCSRGFGRTMADIRADAALYGRLKAAERAWLADRQAERDQIALLESILGPCEVVGMPAMGGP